MSKTNSGLLAYAKAQVGLPYWYGTYGQTATAALYTTKKAQYPSYYTASDFSSQYGKRVHDCAGLIKGYLWSDSETATPKYSSTQDKNAAGFYSTATSKGTISSFPKKLGQLVFKGTTASSINHVGVYDGNGYVYEAKGHAYGVVKTAFKESDWQFWAQCSYITDDSDSASVSDSGVTLVAGAQITLKSVKLYSTSTSTKVAATKTGTYYLWDAKVTNGRIRITNSAANVGKASAITGWIETSAITGTTTSSTTSSSTATTTYAVGDKVKVTGKIYANGNGGNTITKSNAVMYVVGLVNSKTYKYYIGLSATKGGARQGWAEPGILTKM